MADPRNLRAYVSAYAPDRVHVTRLVRGDRATLTADFNGAIGTDRTIDSVTWRCLNPWTLRMADAAIDGRSASIQLNAQWGCGARLRCEATLDDGSKVSQLFRVSVRTAPWFYGEPLAYTQGPYDLTVTA